MLMLSEVVSPLCPDETPTASAMLAQQTLDAKRKQRIERIQASGGPHYRDINDPAHWQVCSEYTCDAPECREKLARINAAAAAFQDSQPREIREQAAYLARLHVHFEDDGQLPPLAPVISLDDFRARHRTRTRKAA